MVALKGFMGLSLVVSGARALSSTLQQITEDVGSNPNGVLLYLYKPSVVAIPTPLIIGMLIHFHICD